MSWVRITDRGEIVRGALQAGEELGCEIVLVGDEVVIADILKKTALQTIKKYP